MKKTYVKVFVEINEDGKKTPTALIYNDIKYDIDKVLEIKKCPSMKVGGIGERYSIRIGNNVTNIFFEKDRWFVEEK